VKLCVAHMPYAKCSAWFAFTCYAGSWGANALAAKCKQIRPCTLLAVKVAGVWVRHSHVRLQTSALINH